MDKARTSFVRKMKASSQQHSMDTSDSLIFAFQRLYRKPHYLREYRNKDWLFHTAQTSDTLMSKST